MLEIQVVDLTQDRHVQGEAILTLRLRFNSQIRPFGVAFADPEDKDALVAFVITELGELFTLTLKKEMWMDKDRAETDSETDRWCRVFSPSVFSFRNPYRLFAISALELVVSLQDGGLLKLQRNPGDHGGHWRDTFFTEGGWGSTLRGLIPFKSHSTIRFGSQELEPNTAAAVALSPDQQHYITVGLDHVLRAWNLQTGKIGLQTDLLGDNDIVEKKVQYLIGAEQSQLLQLVEGVGSNGIQYYAITYSPKQHQFKIWGILDADSGLAGLRDETDGLQLVPPFEELLDTSVWSMEEFHFIPKHHWRETELWIRARTGPISRTFHLKFDLFADVDDLQTVWRSNWVAVDGGSLTVHRLNQSAPSATDPAQDSSYESAAEQWIEYLFYPGRFDSEVLQTALSAYARPTKPQRITAAPQKTLKQRVCEAVASTAEKQHARIASPGETFDSLVFTQWRVYFSLVKDLLKRQAEPLSLAYDAAVGLPWLVLSDFVSPVRLCSDPEALHLNNMLTLQAASQSPSHPLSTILTNDSDSDVARLLDAARGLRLGTSAPFRSTLRTKVFNFVLEEPVEDVSTRLSTFDESLGLCAQISDEEYSRLTEAMTYLGGYETIDDNLFHAVLDKLGEQMRGLPGRHVITRYGAKALIRSVQETLALAIETITDLLLLVVFLALELDQADLSPQFHSADMFVELITQLKEHLMLDWMATTPRPNHASVKHRKRRSSVKGSGSLMDDSKIENTAGEQESNTTQTVMESIFIGDWPSITSPQNEPMSSLLTYWCRAWIYGLDIGNRYDEIASHVLAHLVKFGDVSIAEEFEKFVTLTPWSGYIKGRLALLIGDYRAAAALFRKSSVGLGEFLKYCSAVISN